MKQGRGDLSLIFIVWMRPQRQDLNPGPGARLSLLLQAASQSKTWVGRGPPRLTYTGHVPSSPSSYFGLCFSDAPRCGREYMSHHAGPSRPPGGASPECHPPSPALARDPAIWLIASLSLLILICIHGPPPAARAAPELLTRVPSDQVAPAILLHGILM